MFPRFATDPSCNCSELKTAFNSEFDSAGKAIINVNSKFKAKNSLFNHKLYVAPEAIILSYRNEAHLADGNRVVNKLIPEQYYYISIIQTLKSLFKVNEFSNCIVTEEIDRSSFYPNGVYQNFTDGSFFRSHELFLNASKVALRIQVFYDGMGTTNPLRGHSAPHNLGIFYFTIQNLPSYFNSGFPNIHTFAICHSIDLKKHGFETILKKFMDEINILETDGILVSVPDLGDLKIFASISQFTGDCLATNEIFGLIESFSHDYFCPFCYCTQTTMSEIFNEKGFESRGKGEHVKDLNNLNGSLTSFLHIRGLKLDSVLNRSKFFHTSESRTFDLMHIMAEGILPYVTGCIIYEFIHVRRLITLERLNSRLRNMFSVLEVGKKLPQRNLTT